MFMHIHIISFWYSKNVETCVSNIERTTRVFNNRHKVPHNQNNQSQQVLKSLINVPILF